jgi:hypothetical protein
VSDATGPAAGAVSSAVADAVAGVRARIAEAAARAGRDPSTITLVAATKSASIEQVNAVIAAGVPDVGENRAQDLMAKADRATGARWHFLGRLQRNKVRGLAPWVESWDSVDREPLGLEIARRAPGARVLVEVNLGEEPQKGGCPPPAVPALVEALVEAGLVVDGLMTVPPHDGEPRRWFSALRDLAGKIGVAELSMGMSDDFDVAVEEGATVVRVGRSLFGPRA